MSRMIRRRHVFHIAGYDPVAADVQHRRFRRELATFARTWNVEASLSDLQRARENGNAFWSIATRAGGWQVETTYEPLLWDDVVVAQSAQSMTMRLMRTPAALFDFLGSGAVVRYFRGNWKYALFFLFPYFFLLAFAAVALLAARWVADAFGLVGAASIAATLVLAAAIFVGLMYWPGRRWRVLQVLDDAIFSHDFIRGRRPDLEARLDRFAGILAERARDSSLDEIVVAGHSMGASFAVDVIARALTRDPELGRRGPKICLLTVGSTIPKFTLHPAGERLRRALQRVASEPSIDWAEYQARDDAVSFYKFDPLSETRVKDDRTHGRPVIRRAQFHDMLEPGTYRRYRWKFMRLHYQFVMANERRSVYDYFMLVCGPVPFGRLVRTPGGPSEWIAPDGALRDPGAGAAPETDPARQDSPAP
jgi:hypothetical protein